MKQGICTACPEAAIHELIDTVRDIDKKYSIGTLQMGVVLRYISDAIMEKHDATMVETPTRLKVDSAEEAQALVEAYNSAQPPNMRGDN